VLVGSPHSARIPGAGFQEVCPGSPHDAGKCRELTRCIDASVNVSHRPAVGDAREFREAAPRGEDRRGLPRGSLWRSPRAFFHREPPSEPGRESSRASRAGARGTEHPPLLWLVSTAESPTSPTYRGAGLRVGDPFPGGSAMRFREKAPAPGKHEWRYPLNVGRTFICSLTAATAASPSTPMMTFSRQPGSIGYVGSCPDKQVLR